MYSAPLHESIFISFYGQIVPVVMGSEALKEEEPSPTTTSTARPKTSGGRKPMKAKRNPELSRENSEEAPKVKAILFRKMITISKVGMQDGPQVLGSTPPASPPVTGRPTTAARQVETISRLSSLASTFLIVPQGSARPSSSRPKTGRLKSARPPSARPAAPRVRSAWI